MKEFAHKKRLLAKVYRSSVKEDRNSEVVYHKGEQTDEETDEEIFTSKNNQHNE